MNIVDLTVVLARIAWVAPLVFVMQLCAVLYLGFIFARRQPADTMVLMK